MLEGLDISEDPEGGRPLRQVLMETKSPEDFRRAPISRSAFVTMNRLAFRGGAFAP